MTSLLMICNVPLLRHDSDDKISYRGHETGAELMRLRMFWEYAKVHE